MAIVLHLWRTVMSSNAAFHSRSTHENNTFANSSDGGCIIEKKTVHKPPCHSQRSSHCFPSDFFPISDGFSMTHLMPTGTRCDLLVSTCKELTHVNTRWRLLHARLLTMIEPFTFNSCFELNIFAINRH